MKTRTFALLSGAVASLPMALPAAPPQSEEDCYGAVDEEICLLELRASLPGVTFATGNYLDMDGNAVINLGAPLDPDDAATKAYVDGAVSSGHAATASALSADGGNCPAGQYPLGVDAEGNAQGCTADATDDTVSSAELDALCATDGKILKRIGSVWSCADDATGGGGDNLGNHTATQNIQLGANWLSGDGGNEGIRVDASGRVGIGTVPGTAGLVIGGVDGLLATGIFDSGAIPATGAGTRLMFYPKKAAFRAGFVGGTVWDDANIGAYSVAMGGNTAARGAYSMAMGASSQANGVLSFAMGNGTTANGDYATAIGNTVTANGLTSTAMGSGTVAESALETVIGHFDTNYTPGSAIGWSTSDRLFVIGNGTGDATRSDALVMLKNGNTTLNGQLSVTNWAASSSTPVCKNGNTLADCSGVPGDNLGNHTATQALAMGNNKITALATPTASSDAATKAYVDNASISGNAATATTLAANGSNCAAGQYARGVDAQGNAEDCTLAPAGDNLGSHIAMHNLVMSSYWLSSDGDNEGVAVDNSGRVGVGTNTPGSRLHVKSPAGVFADLTIDTTDSNTAYADAALMFKEAGANSWSIFTDGDSANNPLVFYDYNSSQTAMTLVGQKVGIGTALPAARLQVRGSGTSFDTIGLNVTSSSATSNFMVRDNGQVGIGTDSPTERLQVEGNAKIGPNTTWGAGQQRGIYFGDGQYVFVGEKEADDTLTLKGSRIFLEGGNVGIGTATPTEKLHVAGSIYLSANLKQPARTYHYSITPNEMHPIHRRVTADYFSQCNYALFGLATTHVQTNTDYKPDSGVTIDGGLATRDQYYLAAPIHLPSGAELFSIEVAYFDVGGQDSAGCHAIAITDRLTGSLTFEPVFGYQFPLGTAVGTYHLETYDLDAMSSRLTIDNARYSYELLFLTTTNLTGIGFAGSQMSYELTQLN